DAREGSPMLKRLVAPAVILVLVTAWLAAPSLSKEDAQAKRLAAAVRYIETNKTYTHAFLVQRGDQFVLERYFEGFDKDKLHPLQSATKSITSTLIGIAIDKGHIEGVQQPLHELLPKYDDLLTGKKRRITLEHVLTMTTGLEWRDWRTGPTGKSSFDDIENAADSIRYVLTRPLVTEPGAVFHYNTGSSHLLSAIIHHNTGMTTAAFAERHLFGPLGITAYQWPALCDGIHQGGWGMSMKPRDMLRFGQLMQGEGLWRKKRVVSKAWVDAATRRQVDAVGFEPNGYGYHWWIPRDYGTDVAAAMGYGGQDIFVLKALDTVVVFTGDTRYPAIRLAEPAKILKTYVLGR
nr:serine hydrolase [Planctomycetota bacterium]